MDQVEESTEQLHVSNRHNPLQYHDSLDIIDEPKQSNNSSSDLSTPTLLHENPRMGQTKPSSTGSINKSKPPTPKSPSDTQGNSRTSRLFSSRTQNPGDHVAVYGSTGSSEQNSFLQPSSKPQSPCMFCDMMIIRSPYYQAYHIYSEHRTKYDAWRRSNPFSYYKREMNQKPKHSTSITCPLPYDPALQTCEWWNNNRCKEQHRYHILLHHGAKALDHWTDEWREGVCWKGNERNAGELKTLLQEEGLESRLSRFMKGVDTIEPSVSSPNRLDIESAIAVSQTICKELITQIGRLLAPKEEKQLTDHLFRLCKSRMRYSQHPPASPRDKSKVEIEYEQRYMEGMQELWAEANKKLERDEYRFPLQGESSTMHKTPEPRHWLHHEIFLLGVVYTLGDPVAKARST